MNPAPNQMNDGYEAADAMLEMEYEDRNGCAYTEEETQDITSDVERDICPTCGAEDCDGKCEESDVEPGADMDGDFDSGMTSAGMGYDEQYEHNLCDDYSGE